MKFGYFTLSDNHYPNNPRTSSEFVLEIREQAVLADRLGFNSAWIGEHHFDCLGVNSRPDILLASIIAETKHIRFAPAVCVLPLHHPLHVAESWATLDLLSGGRVDFATGRGYDQMEYLPFDADFMTSAEVFEEGIDVVLKAWNEEGEWSHHGAKYHIDNMSITPKPIQKPIPFYVASFSKTSVDIAVKRGLNIIYAPFAAAMVYGSVEKAVDVYRERCMTEGNGRPGRAMCSYFVHIAENEQEDDAGRQGMIDYFQNCVLRAFPDDPAKMPPTMQYFLQINENLRNMNKEKLSTDSVLIGSKQMIIDRLKEVEAGGIAEVILYFNVGNKPHAIVKEQMHKFAEEIAPEFEESETLVKAG